MSNQMPFIMTFMKMMMMIMMNKMQIDIIIMIISLFMDTNIRLAILSKTRKLNVATI